MDTINYIKCLTLNYFKMELKMYTDIAIYTLGQKFKQIKQLMKANDNEELKQ